MTLETRRFGGARREYNIIENRLLQPIKMVELRMVHTNSATKNSETVQWCIEVRGYERLNKYMFFIINNDSRTRGDTVWL